MRSVELLFLRVVGWFAPSWIGADYTCGECGLPIDAATDEGARRHAMECHGAGPDAEVSRVQR